MTLQFFNVFETFENVFVHFILYARMLTPRYVNNHVGTYMCTFGFTVDELVPGLPPQMKILGTLFVIATSL